MLANGVRCVTLAHGFRDPKAVYALWGTGACISKLQAMASWPDVEMRIEQHPHRPTAFQATAARALRTYDLRHKERQAWMGHEGVRPRTSPNCCCYRHSHGLPHYHNHTSHCRCSSYGVQGKQATYHRSTAGAAPTWMRDRHFLGPGVRVNCILHASARTVWCVCLRCVCVLGSRPIWGRSRLRLWPSTSDFDSPAAWGGGLGAACFCCFKF